MKKKTLLITDERVEECVCGKKYKTWTELCEIKHRGRVAKKDLDIIILIWLVIVSAGQNGANTI